MKKTYRIVEKFCIGLLLLSVMLAACKLGNTPSEDTPPPTPPAPTPETHVLMFKVKALLTSSNDKGFRVYKKPQYVSVVVPKTNSTAKKSEIIAAIKANVTELNTVDIDLYRTNNQNGEVFSENDAALKMHTTVYVGKSSYVKTVSLTLKSIRLQYGAYKPIVAYSNDKTISATVADTASTESIASALRQAIREDVNGANYDTLYKLFSDENALSEATNATIRDGATIFIGKRDNTVSITVKSITSNVSLSGVTFYPINKYQNGGRILSPVVADNAGIADISIALKNAIRNDENTNFDNLYQIFTTATGSPIPANFTFENGGTVYIGKKAYTVSMTVKSITQNRIIDSDTYKPVTHYKDMPSANANAGKEFAITVTDGATTDNIWQEFKSVIKTYTIENISTLATTYDTNCKFFRDAAGTQEATTTDFQNGCIVYIGDKTP